MKHVNEFEPEVNGEIFRFVLNIIMGGNFLVSLTDDFSRQFIINISPVSENFGRKLEPTRVQINMLIRQSFTLKRLENCIPRTHLTKHR